MEIQRNTAKKCKVQFNTRTSKLRTLLNTGPDVEILHWRMLIKLIIMSNEPFKILPLSRKLLTVPSFFAQSS